MKKNGLLFFVLISGLAMAQISTEATSGKWTFGGGIGLGFGSNGYFNVGISPRAGYKVLDNLEVGAQGSLNFQSSDYYKSTMIGIGPFANYYFAQNFYASTLMQHYFVNYTDKLYDYKADAEETALYLGGGYMQRIGTNAAMQIGLMYNVLWRENSSMFSSGFSPTVGFVIGI